MLMTDAMVGSHKPCLQISEDEVDDRQILFGNLGIAMGGDGEVIVATLGEASITTPVISDDFCAGPNRSLNEVAKRLRATVRDNGEPDTTGVSPTLALVELGPRLSLADLNGRGDKDFIMDASAFSVCSPSDRAFVDFDVLAGIAAYPILIWAHHAGAELMENLEGRLVTRDAQLPLKLHGRHPWRLTGYQNRQPRTSHAATYANVPSPSPPSVLCSADSCGIAGHWDDLEIAADRPRTRNRGRRIHRANAVSAGNVRRLCHPGKAAGTLEESEGTEDRRVDECP